MCTRDSCLASTGDTWRSSVAWRVSQITGTKIRLQERSQSRDHQKFVQESAFGGTPLAGWQRCGSYVEADERLSPGGLGQSPTAQKTQKQSAVHLHGGDQYRREHQRDSVCQKESQRATLSRCPQQTSPATLLPDLAAFVGHLQTVKKGGRWRAGSR